LKTVVIVCGYGKKTTGDMIDYIESSFCEIAKDFALKGEHCTVIVSGGDTENGKWKTEAEMMKVVINRMIARKGLPKNMIQVEPEVCAYNTLTNIMFSNRLLGREADNPDTIAVVCNESHYPKTMFACFKVFGLEMSAEKVIFYTFPLTKRFSENIKTYFKTGFEIFGYFFRPFGRYLEYWQWRLRTGRNERLSYWRFRLKYAKSGELI